MWTLVAFNLMLQLIGLFAYYVSFAQAGGRGEGIRYADILTVYQILALTEFLLITCVVPAVASGAVCGERERQTFDPLLSTPLTPLQIVLGKLSASLAIVLLLITSALPVFGLVFSVGGIRLCDLGALYVCLFLWALLLGSISLTISIFCRKTATATVLSYLVMAFLVLGTLLAVGACYALSVKSGRYMTLGMIYRGAATAEAAARDWNLLLLCNPFGTLLALLYEQTGGAPVMLLAYGSDGKTVGAIREHWVMVSAGIQLAATALLWFVAVRKLERSA